MRFVIMALAAGALTLAGCSPEETIEEEEPVEEGGAVSGDVLGGSISDDMLPLEALRSQSPPAERSDRGESRSAQ